MAEYFVSEIPGTEQNMEYMKYRQNISKSFHSTYVSIMYTKVKTVVCNREQEGREEPFFSSLHFLCQTFNISVVAKIIYMYTCVCTHRVRTQYGHLITYHWNIHSINE